MILGGYGHIYCIISRSIQCTLQTYRFTNSSSCCWPDTVKSLCLFDLVPLSHLIYCSSNYNVHVDTFTTSSIVVLRAKYLCKEGIPPTHPTQAITLESDLLLQSLSLNWAIIIEDVTKTLFYGVGRFGPEIILLKVQCLLSRKHSMVKFSYSNNLYSW